MFDIATTRTFQSRPSNAPDARPWIWPLPRIGDSEPKLRSLSSGVHRYADVSYEGDPNLRFVPVLATQDGVITYAGKATTTCMGKTVARYTMCLDHAGGWSTHYGDLEHMFSLSVDRFARRRKQRVRTGDVLGYASTTPLHIFFELWRTDGEVYAPVDPAEHMNSWLVLPWKPAPIAHVQTANQVAA